MKNLIFISVVLFSLMSCHQSKINPKDKYSYPIEDILRKMTLEEKIGQMNQISSWGRLEGEQIDLIRAGYVGSILNEVDPAKINQMQRIAISESRLNIPICLLSS